MYGFHVGKYTIHGSYGNDFSYSLGLQDKASNHPTLPTELFRVGVFCPAPSNITKAGGLSSLKGPEGAEPKKPRCLSFQQTKILKQ